MMKTILVAYYLIIIGKTEVISNKKDRAWSGFSPDRELQTANHPADASCEGEWTMSRVWNFLRITQWWNPWIW